MEPLLKQLKTLPAALGTGGKIAVGLVLAVVIAGAVVLVALGPGSDRYQYAFTNLSAEDSSEAANTLKGANIPFRLEAGGAALAVPEAKVYDARLLLASAGIPRGGGVGFELFDRGDLGVSDFTQKVNFRRALEGELARTISRLAPVRSARVHLTLGEKGLYRDDDHKAAAAIVVNLQPGRTLGEREVAGIRHLVASAAPGLSSSDVSILDGQGTVLATEQERSEQMSSETRSLEKDLEARILAMLEPVVGRGAVVARVTANLDSSEVRSQAEIYDPEGAVVRQEHKNSQTGNAGGSGGVAGAAGNQPQAAPAAPSGAQGRSSSLSDETRSYEISHTTTSTVQHGPRLKRLSVAVLLDGKDDKPRSDTDVTRLGDLAKRAIGFDPVRGDVLDITSSVFTRASAGDTPVTPTAPPVMSASLSKPVIIAGAVAALLILVLAFLAFRPRGERRGTGLAAEARLLRPGANVAELEAQLLGMRPQQLGGPSADPQLVLMERARELARVDPQRAAHLLRAWIKADSEVESNG